MFQTQASNCASLKCHIDFGGGVRGLLFEQEIYNYPGCHISCNVLARRPDLSTTNLYQTVDMASLDGRTYDYSAIAADGLED